MNSELLSGGVVLLVVGLYGLLTSRASGRLYRALFGPSVSDRNGFKKTRSGNFVLPLATAWASLAIGAALVLLGLLGVGA